MREGKRIHLSQLLLGLGLGAVLMYVLDPQQGRQRRQVALGEVQRRIQPIAGAGGGWTSMDRDEWIHQARAHRGGLLGLLVGGAAAGLAVRALLRGGGWRGVAHGGTRGQPIELEKSIHIAAPPEEVYRLWNDYDNFPRFMSMVEQVRPLGGERSHWVVKGPAGARVEWDSVITERVAGRLLAWRSEPGGAVEHAGRVQFTPAASGTRVTVHLSYHPPGGRLGHAVAGLFGRNPEQEMDADLQCMKSFIEERMPVPDSGPATVSGAVRPDFTGAGSAH